MADIETLRIQEYSTNIQLLSQQMTSRLADFSIMQNATGSKAFRMLSQVSKASAVRRTTSAQPAMNANIEHDGRWVYPVSYDWGKVVDDIDTMQTNIQPQGSYVRSAVAALNRKRDELFMSAFFGAANTGETGSTSTSFSSDNVVAVNYATTTTLTVEKLRKALRLLQANDVDLDMEQPICAISPQQHDNLLGITQVTSTDYNKPVLMNGRIDTFLGMKFVISNLLPTDTNSYRRIPIWVPSGMGRGVWKPITGTIRTRPDLQTDPAYVEAFFTEGYTRLEEAKCIEIKCAES